VVATAAIVLGGLGLRAGLQRSAVEAMPTESVPPSPGIVVIDEPISVDATVTSLVSATQDPLAHELPTLPPTYVNVNAATPAELELLPGIGPALASRIIASREAEGPFTSVDDLQRVKGIGPKTVENLRAYATALGE
jgi:competence ComEA-like helix-hairpin-helix protein